MQNILMRKRMLVCNALEVDPSVLEGTEDLEESVIDDVGDVEVEYPEDTRCPPHLLVVVLP